MLFVNRIPLMHLFTHQELLPQPTLLPARLRGGPMVPEVLPVPVSSHPSVVIVSTQEDQPPRVQIAYGVSFSRAWSLSCLKAFPTMWKTLKRIRLVEVAIHWRRVAVVYS